MEVSVGGSSLGTFGPDDSVDFTGFIGGGVTKFTVTGISPTASTSSAEGFPLNISVSSTASTFEMTSISPPSVPGIPGLVSLGTLLTIAGAAVLRWRFRSQRAEMLG